MIGWLFVLGVLAFNLACAQPEFRAPLACVDLSLLLVLYWIGRDEGGPTDER